MLEVGSILDGKYKILNKVGQGGMSVVYLAMNERANKQWAVKEVRKDGVLNFESVKQGLVAETDILKSLSHKHLPSIVDVIDTEDSFIIIMDYVQGNSLDKALRQFGAQPQEDVIKWAIQLCDVLGYLHSQNPPIIYRDMKPANVMLKPDGDIALIDFGTARYQRAGKTEDTTCLGTRGYAAPEQYGGMGQTDARTDIYCLGATIYHLVTGMNPSQPPYEIRPIREIDPSLSSGLEKIILKCTQNNPADRYQSCAELMYDLEHYSVIDDDFIRQQKRKLGLFLGAGALTLLFGGVALWASVAGESAKTANYDYMLQNAVTVNDYYETILTDPGRTDAYLDPYNGLLANLTADGELSTEESQVLMQLRSGIEKTGGGGFVNTVDVLSQLKSADEAGYRQVCYEIGETYLFYYNVGVEKDKYQSASMWLKETTDTYPVAGIYCKIADCLQNIAKHTKANQTAKLYESYQSLWTEITTLMDESTTLDDDMKILVWSEIVQMVDNNCKEFCEVATGKGLKALLNNIFSRAAGISNGILETNIAELQNMIGTTLTKVDAASAAK